MKFNRISATNFFEQDATTASLVKILIYYVTTGDTIIFDDLFVANNKKWIICFVKGSGQISEIKTKALDDLFKGNNYSGYLIWIDSYKSLDNNDYLQRHKYIALVKNKISDYQLHTEPKDGNTSAHILTFYGFENQNITISTTDISFSKIDAVKFSVNSSEATLNKLIIDISATSESRGSFQLSSTFDTSQGSFINAKMGFISERRLSGTADKESLLTMDLFDPVDLENALFSGTYYPFEEIYNSADDNYLSKFKILKPNLKTNFIDSLGSRYYSDFDNSDMFLCFSQVVNNKVKSGNDPQWDKYILRPLGKLKLKTHNNAKILLGSSGTESFKNSDDSFEISFEDSENVVVDEKNVVLKKHNDKTRLSLIKTSPVDYNLDSEKSPIFKNTVSSDFKLKQVPYDSIIFSSDTVIEALPIIPTLSFKSNPELFELEETFKKIRLKAHQKTKALKKISPKEVEYLKSAEDYITPQGFQKNKTGYDFIQNQNKSNKKELFDFQFSLEGIDTDLDISLRKDQVFFVLTPALFKKYTDTVKQAKLNAKFAINKDTSEGDNKIEFIVDLTSSFYPKAENGTSDPSATTHTESIILFKFHREKLSNLIGNLNLWTNEGLLNDNLKLIQTAITENKNFKDDYFKNTILEDENWNGVLILNIPITDSESLPKIFTGLSSSQEFFKKGGGKVELETNIKFQYAAFPVNKTKIENGKIEIKSTSFYGLIDYNPFANSNDYSQIEKHFNDEVRNNDPYKFLLSKLKVSFANSSIKLFESFAFIQVPNLFEDKVKFDKTVLQNAGYPSNPVKKSNLIQLIGSYQKNSAGEGEISFSVTSDVTISFDDNPVLNSIVVNKLGFKVIDKAKDVYSFDIDAKVNFADSIAGIGQVFSFDRLDFQNVGLRFDLSTGTIPLPNFDLSRLLVLPKINFNGSGFLSSFPIKFSYFQNFSLPVIPGGGGKFNFGNPEFDFFNLQFNKPSVDFEWPDINVKGNLFSFVFDFDLGTLGNLSGLKDFKGQLLVGWSPKGGFALGFKMNGPSSDGLHIDLFGALKLDIEELGYGKFNPKNSGKQEDCTAYFLRLNNAKLTILGTQIPSDSTTFDGVIISDFRDSGSKKVSWLINLSDNGPQKKLLLGLGQRSGPGLNIDTSSTKIAIERSKSAFQVNLKDIPDCSVKASDIGYQPDRNWFIASEDVMSLISKEWAKTIDVKFIFNDPKLYGLYLGFKDVGPLSGLSIDILYKKLSDSLGVYSTEIQLPDALRNREMGGASLRLPNIGIEIYTNGDWKGDIGFPKDGNDWSRSGFIQLRTAPPFVGWFGFYLMQSKIASLTLFNGYISDDYSKKNLNILQAGFAMRVGLGAYLDGGIYYVGASISVYGVLEGAFAFKKDNGLAALFPDHFAVLGRVGAIAELVGYVNFVIVKAAIYISLRAEFGMLLVYLGESIEERGKGLQPVKVYVEGEVIVAIRVTLFCVKFFRKKWCLVIHLSFRAFVRFEYTIGGSDSSKKIVAKQQFKLAETKTYKLSEEAKTLELPTLAELPMVFIPSFTRSKEAVKEETLLINNFYIPFFGVKFEDNKLQPSKINIFKDKIIQPFLSDLITELAKIGINNTYETIRGVLLEGECFSEGTNTRYTIKLKVPNYRPKFIDDINSTDDTLLTDILKNDFGFDDEEALLFIQNDKCKATSSTGINKECPYRAIPAPISKNITVNNQKIDDGFDILIEELVMENGSSIVKSRIDDLKTTQIYLDKLEDYFDDYKTQFIDRNQAKFKDTAADVELRENFLIPEFFKLVALLTLEKSYSKANPKKKEGESYNPFVKVVDGDISFSVDKTSWEKVSTNENIDEVIGQLNYFYNSGLRLPNNETEGDEKTISINSLIEQTKTITPIDIANRDWSKTKILIAGQDITNNIYGKDIVIGGVNHRQETLKDVWEFVDNFETNNGFDFNKLEAEFEPILFVRPYELINVTLGLQTNHKKVLNPDDSEKNRFYEIPKKLFKHGSSVKDNKVIRSKFSFELSAAKYDNSKGNSASDEVFASTLLSSNNAFELSKCLNIQIQVKQSDNKTESVNGGKIVLEINNVLADDLTLITLLKEEQFGIDTISFYGKREKDGKSYLMKLTETGSTIIKTNLSPRTSPPIFSTANFKKRKQSNLNKFIEDSNNPLDSGKTNFTRLVWESLTTNNGGYYLTFDNTTEFPNDLTEIVVSFESKQKDIPYFFNALNIKYDKILFEGLDKNELYLYIEHLNQDNDPVLEYHPTIPAHDFGFEVKKSTSSSENYQQYLPLEFGLKLKGATKDILSYDKVLPIMPSSPTEMIDGRKELANDGQLIYNHISPLLKNDDGTDNNIHRYSAVGKNYILKLGLRDIYGFRTSIHLDEKEYKHLYFDKLVPLESWPLIKFSYWFKKFDKTSNSLHWTMKGYYDIREILDLAGIPKNPDNNYKYDFDSTINDHDLNEIGKAAKGIYNSLNTILAQLTDSGNKLTLENYNGTDAQTKVKDKIQALLSDIESLFKNKKMPSKGSKNPIEFNLITAGLEADEIESEISFKIIIKRTKNTIVDASENDYKAPTINHSFKDLKTKASIWEYESVEEVSTLIPASNNNDGTSNLKMLNKVVEVDSLGKFCLGLSSDKNLERVLFLTNKEALKKLKIKQKYLDNDGLTIKKAASYLGIKPIKNKLWAGNYELNGKTSGFSNIDLDKSLRIVLETIDSLLDKNSISSKLKTNSTSDEAAHKTLLEKLIASKKAISLAKLKDQIDWVMEEIEIEGTNSKNELKEIILNKLTNFYAYDGIISTEIENTAVLKGHRLTLSLDAQQKYNLISSKVTETGKWNIFFDQEENLTEDINFSIIPKITHIELGDFSEVSNNDDEDVRNSQWIQLIEPIELTIPNTTNTSTTGYKVTDWKRIIREFPPKPIITKHEAIQVKMPGQNVWSIDAISKLPDAGKWEYFLSVEDRYLNNDRIDVELIIKDAKMAKEDTRSFEGFISYWATHIPTDEFDWKEFVEDISTLLTSAKTIQNDGLTQFKYKVTEPIRFVLVKESKAGVPDKWKVETQLQGELKVEIVGGVNPNEGPKPELKVIGFNIFSETQKAFSILPVIKIQRNFDVKNNSFRYETDKIEPTTPATPLLRHYNPLSIKSTDTFLDKVFSKNISKLPFKATAKYLVDIDENFPKVNSKQLPIIPIMQIESDGKLHQEIDEIFSTFDKSNGYSAYSYIIYNRENDNSDLPILYVDTIFKLK